MALLGIDQVVHELYVHQSALKAYSVVGQDVALELEVVSVFHYFRTCNDVLEVFRCAESRMVCSIFAYGNGHVPDFSEDSRLCTFCYHRNFSRRLCHAACVCCINRSEAELLLFLRSRRLYIADVFPQ